MDTSESTSTNALRAPRVKKPRTRQTMTPAQKAKDNEKHRKQKEKKRQERELIQKDTLPQNESGGKGDVADTQEDADAKVLRLETELAEVMKKMGKAAEEITQLKAIGVELYARAIKAERSLEEALEKPIL